MIGRRQALTAGAVMFAAALGGPLQACRSPKAKDRSGYGQAIDSLLKAWWDRDLEAFQAHFRAKDVEKPFDGKSLFAEFFDKPEARFKASTLFNGASAVVQIVEPAKPNYEMGICGDHAGSNLFLIKFFPGLDEPVISELKHIDYDLLAKSEWQALRG